MHGESEPPKKSIHIARFSVVLDEKRVGAGNEQAGTVQEQAVEAYEQAGTAGG